MDHFYQKITGWFDFADLYSDMVKTASQNAQFVELGCFFGRSTAYMAVEILNSRKNIIFDVVDKFNFNEDSNLDEIAQMYGYKGDFYNVFIQNIEPVKFVIRHIWRMDTAAAAEMYQDRSVDFVFVDDSHTYSNTRADVIAWLPKLKSGGVIAGHDIGRDSVKKAVDELLDWQKVSASCWYYRKD